MLPVERPFFVSSSIRLSRVSSLAPSASVNGARLEMRSLVAILLNTLSVKPANLGLNPCFTARLNLVLVFISDTKFAGAIGLPSNDMDAILFLPVMAVFESVSTSMPAFLKFAISLSEKVAYLHRIDTGEHMPVVVFLIFASIIFLVRISMVVNW